jgi:cytochrome d ubiquinol oxidase subunit II
MAIVSILIPFVLAYIWHAWWSIDQKKLDLKEITDEHAY